MTPKVSVCLPVFNGAQHIEATVEAILLQTFTDFELVVVDNRSTDDTLARMSRFADPRMRVHVNDHNLGATANWNRAISFATGRYTKVVCADDLLYPECLSEQVAVLDADPDVVLVAAQRDVVDDKGKMVLRRRGLGRMRGRVSGSAALRSIARSGTNPLGEPAAVLLRTEALRKAGPFDGDLPYMIDVDMWTRVLQHGDLHAIDRPLCAFRLAQGSWSEQLAKDQGRQAAAFVGRLRARNPKIVTAWDERIGIGRAMLLGKARRALYRVLRIRDRVGRRV